jgi:hypothetical protein
MVRVIIVFVILIGVASGLIGQPSEMNQDQLEEYGALRLDIDPPSVMPVFPLDISLFWSVRRGTELLSESGFYDIAGYPEQSKKSFEYKALGWTMLIGGCGLQLAGMTLIFDNSDNAGIAAICNLSGLVLICFGADRFRHNGSPIDQARAAADEFNAKLATRIIEKANTNPSNRDSVLPRGTRTIDTESNNR